MKTMNFSELKQNASDRFSYILVFCPNFPPYTRTTTKTAFEKLVALIDSVMGQLKNEESKQWLRVCLQEVRESWKNYDDGKLTEARKLIQRAQAHFDNAFSKKPMEPRFTAGETGAALDSDKGFPE